MHRAARVQYFLLIPLFEKTKKKKKKRERAARGLGVLELASVVEQEATPGKTAAFGARTGAPLAGEAAVFISTRPFSVLQPLPPSGLLRLFSLTMPVAALLAYPPPPAVTTDAAGLPLSNCVCLAGVTMDGPGLREFLLRDGLGEVMLCEWPSTYLDSDTW